MPQVASHELAQLEGVIGRQIYALRLKIQALDSCKINADLLRNAQRVEKIEIRYIPKVCPHASDPNLRQIFYELEPTTAYNDVLYRMASVCFDVEAQRPDSPHLFKTQRVPLQGPNTQVVQKSKANNLKPYVIKYTCKTRNCLGCHAQVDQDAKTTALNLHQEIGRITELTRRLENIIPALLLG